MTNTNTISRRAVRAILGACTWAVGLRSDVTQYSLTDDECESEGRPLGSVEPCAYAFPLVSAPWWRVDAWDDGECLNVRVLGWSLEVHHKARQGPTDALACRGL